MNGPQKPGGINGINPLQYQGNTPNMVTFNRRPTVQDGISWPIGMWWIIPIDLTFTEGEVWTLVSKSQGINIWKKLENTVPPDTKTGLVFLEKSEASLSSPAAFLSLSGDYFNDYLYFQINFSCAPSSGNNGQLNMYVSTDNGSTLLSVVGGGLVNFDFTTAASTVLSTTITGGIPVGSNLNNALNGGTHGNLLFAYAQGSPYTVKINGVSSGSNAANLCSSNFGGLWLNGVGPINYIKFIYESSSSSIFGDVSIYGYIQG